MKNTEDGIKLESDFGIKPANLVELGAYARQADPAFPYARNIVSLAKMVEQYCDGKVLEKGSVRTGNWEVVPLSEAQKFCTCLLLLLGLTLWLVFTTCVD